MNEAIGINKSLSALGGVVSALVEGKRHIPYMNNQLTQLLRDSIGNPRSSCQSPRSSALGGVVSALVEGKRHESWRCLQCCPEAAASVGCPCTNIMMFVNVSPHGRELGWVEELV